MFLRVLSVALLVVAGCSPWRTFHSPDSRFSVELPGEPAQTGLRLNTALGYLDAMRASAEDGGVTFAATVAELPPDLLRRAGVKAVLQGQQQVEVAAKKDKIIDVQWDADVQGVRFVYLREASDAVGCYYFIRGGRLFLLSVEGPLAEARGARAARFFNSLELVP